MHHNVSHLYPKFLLTILDELSTKSSFSFSLFLYSISKNEYFPAIYAVNSELYNCDFLFLCKELFKECTVTSYVCKAFWLLCLLYIRDIFQTCEILTYYLRMPRERTHLTRITRYLKDTKNLSCNILWCYRNFAQWTSGTKKS